MRTGFVRAAIVRTAKTSRNLKKSGTKPRLIRLKGTRLRLGLIFRRLIKLVIASDQGAKKSTVSALRKEGLARLVASVKGVRIYPKDDIEYY